MPCFPFRTALSLFAALGLPFGPSAQAATAPSERAPDYPAALERAQSTGGDIVVLQRGSDWNRLGETLHRDVWSQPAFLRALGPGFILVEVDRPEFPGAPGLLERERGAGEQAIARFRDYTRGIEAAAPPSRITAVTSAAGAVYQPRADGSWLAQPGAAKAPQHDTLAVTVTVPRGTRLLRLDFPPDPSLPNQAAGLASNGNFALNEIRATDARGPRALTAAWASYAEGNSPASRLIDGVEDKPDQVWNPGAHTAKRRTLLLALAEAQPVDGDLTLTLVARSQWGAHIPGCLLVGTVDEPFVADGLARHAAAVDLAARNAAFDWQANWSVPRIALLDAQGRGIAAEDKPRPPFDADALARRVHALREVRLRRDEVWTRAEKASGPEKAELLRQGLEILGLGNSRGNGKRYEPVHAAIKAADPEDASGATRWLGFSLDPKGGVPWAKPAWNEALDTKGGTVTLTDDHYREALARVDKELADPRNRILPPEYVQRMMLAKYHIHKRWKGHEDERFEVQRAIAAFNPGTFWGIGARGYLGQYKRSPMPYLSYGWGPRQLRTGRQTWEITDTAYFFAQPAPHRLTFTHRGGKENLRIHRAALMDGERVFAEARPARDCGPGTNATVVCTLDARAWKPGLTLTLRVEVESAAETPDSEGSFSVEPIFDEPAAASAPAWIPSERRRALAADLLARMDKGGDPAGDSSARRDLALHELLRRAGHGADAVAARPGGSALLDALAADADWMEALLVCDKRDWAQVLENLRLLHRHHSAAFADPVHRRMGSAMALEAGAMNRYRLQDRFAHMRRVHQTGLLHAKFDTLTIREMTWAVWLAGTAEDYQFMVDDMQTTWADYLGACWAIPYIDPNVYGYSVQGWGYVDPWVHHHGNGSGDRPYRVQRTVGGVCGTLSGYGSAAARAHGVMAVTVGQPGHCAYVVRVDDQWRTGNDVSGHETNGASVFEGTGFASMHRLYEAIHADPARLLAASRRMWVAHLEADRNRTEVRVRPGLTFRQYRVAEGKLTDLPNGVLERSGPAAGFDLAAAAPADTANLAIVWEGEVEILGPGKPRVSVTVNEVAALTVGGKVIPTAKGWQEIPLEAGVHPVRLEYGNKGGTWNLNVEWGDAPRFDPAWYKAARAALAAQPENVPHWLELAKALEAAADQVPPAVWRECGLAAAEAFAAWHEAGWSLANRFLGRVLPGLPVAERRELLRACHQHLRQENAPHYFGFNLGGVLDTHAGWLKEPAEQVGYFRDILRIHDAASPDARRVFGEVLAWGQRRLGGTPATAALFIPALGECFPEEGAGKAPGKLSELILSGLRAAVEKNDPAAHRLWRELAAKRLPAPTLADLFLTEAEAAAAPRPEPFPGALVSADASLRLSSASANDRLLSHAAVLDGSAPGFFETNPEEKPWVQVQLAGEVEPSGLVVVNRYESPVGQDRFSRSFPFVVLASTDGKTWTEVARVDSPAPAVRVDLAGKVARARFIRIERAAASPARKLHFRNVLVYGRKLY